MSSSISPLAHALRLLKVELAEARGKQPENRTAAEPRAAGAPAAANQPTALRRLPAALKSIRSRDGRLQPSKALRLFIEAVLVDELGSEMQLDAAFGDLVERTCRALEQDAGNASLLTDALTELEALAD